MNSGAGFAHWETCGTHRLSNTGLSPSARASAPAKEKACDEESYYGYCRRCGDDYAWRLLVAFCDGKAI